MPGARRRQTATNTDALVVCGQGAHKSKLEKGGGAHYRVNTHTQGARQP
jgi:hypothetical protein